MPADLPNLFLTYGQLLWAINYGREPDRELKDRARYLRTLGVPVSAGKQGRGSGSRIQYDFYDLVEVGLGVTALKHRARPRDITAVLIKQREEMYEHFRSAWREIPEAALYEDWVKSRGRQNVLFDDELFMRIHDRRSEQWGKIDIVGPSEATRALPVFEPVERFEDGPPKPLIPMKRLMIQWVVWAQEAPLTKPGPGPKKQ